MVDKIRRKCWRCKGTGKVSCHICHGTKTVPFGPEGKLYTCYECYGTGKECCDLCDGRTYTESSKS